MAMDRQAFTDRQHAIRAQAAAMMAGTIAMRAENAAIRRELEAMRAACSATPPAPGTPSPSGQANGRGRPVRP
jgi:hypothetical protein